MNDGPADPTPPHPPRIPELVMTPRVLPAAALLALGACAAGTQQIVSPRAERLEPGATYRV